MVRKVPSLGLCLWAAADEGSFLMKAPCEAYFPLSIIITIYNSQNIHNTIKGIINVFPGPGQFEWKCS